MGKFLERQLYWRYCSRATLIGKGTGCNTSRNIGTSPLLHKGRLICQPLSPGLHNLKYRSTFLGGGRGGRTQFQIQWLYHYHHHHHHHHKHQGLDPLIRSFSKVTTALSNVSSVFQLQQYDFKWIRFYGILCKSCVLIRNQEHRRASADRHRSICMYNGFKTSFYVVRHLDSTASYLPTGLQLDFFRSWPSLYLPSSFSSVFLVLYSLKIITEFILKFNQLHILQLTPKTLRQLRLLLCLIKRTAQLKFLEFCRLILSIQDVLVTYIDNADGTKGVQSGV